MTASVAYVLAVGSHARVASAMLLLVLPPAQKIVTVTSVLQVKRLVLGVVVPRLLATAPPPVSPARNVPVVRAVGHNVWLDVVLPTAEAVHRSAHRIASVLVVRGDGPNATSPLGLVSVVPEQQPS